MGAGSAPAVSLPDVSLVFGISLLLGFSLMMMKEGANFGDNLLTNLILIILAFAMTVHGVYYAILINKNQEDDDYESSETLDAEILDS